MQTLQILLIVHINQLINNFIEEFLYHAMPCSFLHHFTELL
jgi:hypothetical protein